MTDQSSPLSTRDELLRRAAQCYTSSGLTDDAIRLYVTLQDYELAARNYEQRGQYSLAADYFARVGAWANAARCYERGGQRKQEANARYQAGELVTAAWLFAHYANLHVFALKVLDSVNSDDPHERLLIDITLARCDIERHHSPEAVKRMETVIARFYERSNAYQLQTAFERSLQTLEVLNRRDLTLQLFAAYCSSGAPEGIAKWEAWAQDQLGDRSFLASLQLATVVGSRERDTEPEVEPNSD